VDVEIYEKAQQARLANTRPFFRDYDKSLHLTHDDYLFKGLLFCGDCGSAMKRRYTGTRTDVYSDRFFCPIQRRRLGAGCSCKSVMARELYVSALASIKAQIEKAVDVAALVSRLNKEQSATDSRDVLSERIATAQRELNRQTGLKASLYESYADKLLTESEYIYSKQQYEQRIDGIKREIERLQKESVIHNETLTPKNKWLVVFQRFIGHDELSKEMIEALIEKVIVRDNGRFEFIWRFRDEHDAICDYTAGMGANTVTGGGVNKNTGAGGNRKDTPRFTGSNETSTVQLTCFSETDVSQLIDRNYTDAPRLAYMEEGAAV